MSECLDPLENIPGRAVSPDYVVNRTNGNVGIIADPSVPQGNHAVEGYGQSDDSVTCQKLAHGLFQFGMTFARQTQSSSIRTRLIVIPAKAGIQVLLETLNNTLPTLSALSTRTS